MDCGTCGAAASFAPALQPFILDVAIRNAPALARAYSEMDEVHLQLISLQPLLQRARLLHRELSDDGVTVAACADSLTFSATAV